ncbi:MAG: ABC transporter permease subunit, partial [Pseudonocardia sp.]|nr:ABC transporter permease subunit [Pseudonocardia sp.]
VIGVLLPFVPLLVWSVSRTWAYPALLPQETSLRAVRLVTDPGSAVVGGLATSLAVATTVAVISGAIGLCAGRALGLHSFRGKRAVQFLLLAPVIVPPFAVTLGIQILFIRYGLADSVPGVVLAHLVPATPYVTLVLAATYANYDTAYEDQARVLGAAPWQVLWRVTLPAVRPGLAVAMLFAFLISWSEYILTLLVGGGAVQTLPLVLFAAVRTADTPVVAAVSLVIVLPPLLLVGLTSRFLTASAGGVAGLGRL